MGFIFFFVRYFREIFGILPQDFLVRLQIIYLLNFVIAEFHISSDTDLSV